LTQERKLGLSGPSVLLKEDFLKNWNQFTGGILDGLDWTNVFAAGGAILACLSKEQEGYKSSDIDLFVYGLDNDEDANRKVNPNFQPKKKLYKYLFPFSNHVHNQFFNFCN